MSETQTRPNRAQRRAHVFGDPILRKRLRAFREDEARFNPPTMHIPKSRNAA